MTGRRSVRSSRRHARVALYTFIPLVLFAWGLWMFREVTMAASLALIGLVMIVVTLHSDVFGTTPR
jgi:TRAP-type uncharacterized transport system fused permease subunit